MIFFQLIGGTANTTVCAANLRLSSGQIARTCRCGTKEVTSWQSRPWASLRGQAVGIKEVHDDIWLVSFMDYDLGYFDLDTRVLEPLDNPFGPKVSPM